MPEITPKAKFCYEISWEICNKVGGIYTVVSSKASQMINKYGKENFFMIGPFFPKKAYGIFADKVPDDKLKAIFDRLKGEGIDCHYGEWLVKGNPNTILIDFSGYTKNKDAIKKELWDKYKIDSLLTEYFDFDEPLMWSWAAGRLLEEIKKEYQEPIVAQCHEWLAGGALLYLKSRNVKIGTVFTTHATMLGRTLASQGVDLYGQLEKIDAEKEARDRGIISKFHMEKQCALNADVFTTVSEITGLEAEHLLGKKPDVLLPNGLDMSKFPTFEETSVKHNLFKAKIKEFITYYFFPYYQFDLNNTLLYFIAGRYEFKDKGIDVFIQALGRLNEAMKKEENPKTIVTFFWVPGNIKSINPNLLQNRTLFRDVADSIDDELPNIRNSILSTLLQQKEIQAKLLFSEELHEELRRKLRKFKQQGKPPLSTHLIYNPESDAILSTLQAVGLDNSEDDPVKVVYYPIYLTGADGLLDTSYYESMLGSHLGVFPSYYEPWGYTPLEAGALGVASVTTDLAGFGRYICTECEQEDQPGIFVLFRHGKSDEQVITDLTKTLHTFAHFTKHQRIENKISARKIAETADWAIFIKNYITAHNQAIDKVTQQG